MAERVAIVTGASSGIGDATARRLHALGFTVHAGARRVERMRELETLGIHIFALDVTNDDSMTRAVGRITTESGRIDVLVNNAGYAAYGALEDVPLEEARHQFEVNVFGLARMTQLVLPGMRSRRSGRWTIDVSSIGGKVYGPLGGWYHATKHAVEGLSDSLRLELAPLGIRVVIIEPGEIRTEWGGIAADSLLATSGSGPYAAQAERISTVLTRSVGANTGSPPSVVADAIGRAATARRPRTRYVVGRGARTLTMARRLLPDRAFDRVMRRVFEV